MTRSRRLPNMSATTLPAARHDRRDRDRRRAAARSASSASPGRVRRSIGETIVATAARAARRDPSRLSAARDDEALDEGLALYFPAPRVVYGRGRVSNCTGTAGPRSCDCCSRACRRTRRAARAAGRIHATRVPERQARSRAGGRRRRSDRRGDGDSGARGGAQSRRGVLARDPRARRRGDRASDVHRGDARFSRTRTSISCARPTRGTKLAAIRAQLERGAGAGEAGRAAARRPRGRARRRAQRRQVEPLESARRRRRRRSSRRSPGTTRDTVRAQIEIRGIPLTVIDTAGLRPTDDPIETLGIERTWAAIARRRTSRSCWSTPRRGARPRAPRIAAILAQLPRGTAAHRRPQQDRSRPGLRGRWRRRAARRTGDCGAGAIATSSCRRRPARASISCSSEILAHRRRARGHGRRVPRAASDISSRCARPARGLRRAQRSISTRRRRRSSSSPRSCARRNARSPRSPASSPPTICSAQSSRGSASANEAPARAWSHGAAGLAVGARRRSGSAAHAGTPIPWMLGPLVDDRGPARRGRARRARRRARARSDNGSSARRSASTSRRTSCARSPGGGRCSRPARCSRSGWAMSAAWCSRDWPASIARRESSRASPAAPRKWPCSASASARASTGSRRRRACAS